MTRISKELLKKAGILPKLRLGVKKAGGGVVPTGAHRVVILEDRIIKKLDQTGKEVEYVQYIVEENGERKHYDTKLRGRDGKPSYLVQRIAEIPEGTEVFIEMKKSGAKNYVDVTEVNKSSSVEVEEADIDDESEEVINPNETLDEQ